MAKELIKSTGGYYYVVGRKVFRAPTKNIYSDGTVGMQMGFEVCECHEWVDGAAEHIALALNEHEKISPPADEK